MADDVLRQGVQGISDLITLPGPDQPRLRRRAHDHVRGRPGAARHRHGHGRAAARWKPPSTPIESPLLETSVEGARSILLSITGGRDLSLWEVNEAAKAVAEAAHPDANIIFGAMVDEKVDDQVWVTVVATGYGDRPQLRRRSPRGEPRIPADAEPSVRRGRDAAGAGRGRRAGVHPRR